MTSFTCQQCGATFTVPDAALKKYPDWTPRLCNDCRGAPAGKKRPRTAAAATPEAALAKFDGGPADGVFTDGGCDPNPGAGGWAAVHVRDGAIVERRAGHEARSTNNRMELRALIEGFAMLAPDDETTIYSDSQYVVKTVNEWAASWERNGWRRGKAKQPVLNLDLVQELLAAARAHPRVKVAWLRGHAGARWNEYVDALVREQQRNARGG